MHTVVEKLVRSTFEYENEYNKKLRKEKGQFFTPIKIAKYMSELTNIYNADGELKILDPAGGTGILSVILLIHILENSQMQKVLIDIYEIDKNILPILSENIEMIKIKYHEANRVLYVNIYNENFVTAHKDANYDIVIGNPPYIKVNKNVEEAVTASKILFGQPNMYMIFMFHSLKLLKQNGQLIFIVPRSFFNGRYFYKFRQWLYKNYSITYIHSFESRSRVFSDRILQEFIIIKIENKIEDELYVNYSVDESNIEKNRAFKISSEIIWEIDLLKRIRLPINQKDVELLEELDRFDLKFKDLSLSFKTGPIVDFRIKKGLYKKKMKDSVPLIWCSNFDSYRIRWPIKNAKFEQYIDYRYNKNTILPMGNYIFVKRFASKEEERILKINILVKDDFPYDYIGVENHVNYLMFNNKNIEIMKGIFILLNSNIYNRYFKIINGTTQINTTDLNDLPVFSYEVLKKISNVNISFDDLTSNNCDNIIMQYINS